MKPEMKLQAETIFPSENVELKLQPKLDPPNRKSWLRPCIYLATFIIFTPMLTEIRDSSSHLNLFHKSHFHK